MDNLLQANEISCRIQQISEKGLSLLLYVTSRDGQKRLDEKYGPLGWQDRYEVIDGDLYCIISAWDEEKKMWISKEDVGTASYTAKEKGRASDAFKRACVKHGIGRELYTAPFIWINAKDAGIKVDSKGKAATRKKFVVNLITYTSDRKIDELEIVDDEMNIVYKKYPSQKIDSVKYDILVKKLDESHVSMDAIVELFHVNTLHELDIDQWNKCMRKLEVTIAANAGKKGDD
ncbi:MAG: hypothetical protein ACLT3H_02630 [Roseburia sp.]